MSYQPYQPPGDDEGRAGLPPLRRGDEDWTREAGGVWRVVVEYANNGQAKPPTVVKVGQRSFLHFDEALASAHLTAFDYNPPDPWSLQSREVYRDGPHSYLVVLQGATSTFHMSVRAVRVVTS